MSHSFIIWQRAGTRGWRANMGNDFDALQELLRVSKPGGPPVLVHYLYVPTKEVGARVSAELRQHGFQTEDRLGADGVNWLVLARHEVVPTPELLTTTRKQMETLAANVDGEYDGWEAEVL